VESSHGVERLNANPDYINPIDLCNRLNNASNGNICDDFLRLISVYSTRSCSSGCSDGPVLDQWILVHVLAERTPFCVQWPPHL
jgi:hypothetical protein